MPDMQETDLEQLLFPITKSWQSFKNAVWLTRNNAVFGLELTSVRYIIRCKHISNNRLYLSLNSSGLCFQLAVVYSSFKNLGQKQMGTVVV